MVMVSRRGWFTTLLKGIGAGMVLGGGGSMRESAPQAEAAEARVDRRWAVGDGFNRLVLHIITGKADACREEANKC